MGMLDFIFGDKEQQQAKKIEGLKKKLTNIWAQPPDRYQAAEQLLQIATPQAFDALLARFQVQVQNTTYDNEEKQYVCDHLVNLGAPIVRIVKAAIHRSEEQINWHLRVLEELLSEAEMAEFVRELLAKQDVDYVRNPEKKEQLLLRAVQLKQFDELAQEVARFVVDDNETIRFQAVNQVISHQAPWVAEALRRNLKVEDSGRILRLTHDWFSRHPSEPVVDPKDQGAARFVAEHLPAGHRLSEDGTLARR